MRDKEGSLVHSSEGWFIDFHVAAAGDAADSRTRLNEEIFPSFDDDDVRLSNLMWEKQEARCHGENEVAGGRGGKIWKPSTPLIHKARYHILQSTDEWLSGRNVHATVNLDVV